MAVKFIERGTEYPLEHGLLTIYETNCSCRDVKFYFEESVMTAMLSGHKTVDSENFRIEFFPGTFFIPEKKVVQRVSMLNATLDNPTKCIVLKVDSSFLSHYYNEIFYTENDKSILKEKTTIKQNGHFLSNNQQMLQNLNRLYKNCQLEQNRATQMIGTVILKELLLRVFQTEALFLLKDNIYNQVQNECIQRSITYIKDNLDKKIAIKQLAEISGFGTTTFFKRFKEETSKSPIDYVLEERIKQSKILIIKNEYNLKEIAFKCGFKSYEYFCSSFKKIEHRTPTEFRSLEYEAYKL